MNDSGDRRDHSVSLTRLEGKLNNLDQKMDLTSTAILAQIEFADKGRQQLVVLMRSEMERVQKDISRIEGAQREQHVEAQAAIGAIDERLAVLEGFKNKLIGAVVFASIFTGVITAAMVKLLGL